MQDIFAEFKAALASGKSAKIKAAHRTITLELSDNSARYSISIRNRQSVRLQHDLIQSVEILDWHPLLLEHNDVICEAYISSPPSDVAAFMADLRRATKDTTGRNLRRFANNLTSLRKVITEGGLLLRGPRTLALAAVRVAASHGALISKIAVTSPTTPKQIMLMDDDYIIADRFTWRRMPTNDDQSL